MNEPETEPLETSDEPEQGDENETPAEPAVDPDEEPERTPEDVTEPAPHGLTPEALEKRARNAEQRFERYAKGLADLYEEESLRWLPCPLCPDQFKGFVSMDDAGRVPQEVQEAVKMFLGIAREQDYSHSTSHRTCPECEGKGKVATGSTVPGNETISCPNCLGKGYVGPPVAAPSPNGNVTGPTVLGAEVVPSQAREDVDEWDEPRILPDGRENPNFGRMPNRKILVEPYGVTAGLNALSA